MQETIRSVFNDECKALKIDARLIRALHLYQVGFVNKDRQHIEFFGGHTIGVQKVKFMPEDRDRWFSEILRVEEGPLEMRLDKLDAIDHEHKIIGSDTMNLSAVWLAHAIMQSKVLSDRQKKEGCVDVMLVLQYKFLTSRLYRHFLYPADEGVAEATYAALSGRYLIKKYGKWSALFNARAEEIISKDGIHYQTLMKFEPDDDIIDMLNDIQGRIRDMLKNIYNEYLIIHARGEKIVSTSSVVELDGAEILRDKTKNLSAYNQYIHSVITDKNSFIREELVNVITKVMGTMPPALFRTTLEYMSDNYQSRYSKEIHEILNETILHSFSYLADHRELVSKNTDLAELISRLRGVYTSSRSTDIVLFKLREMTEKLVHRATGNKNDSVLASVRTGILLYIVLRSFTMRYYSTHG